MNTPVILNRSTLFAALLCFCSLALIGQDVDSTTTQAINDGPYVFIRNDSLIQKDVIDGVIQTSIMRPGSLETNFLSAPSIYTEIDKVAALSDIHGQFELAVEILTNNKIIDRQQNWKFGNGHLVIVGDIFDRGEKVTEFLWLVYKIEKQARAKGGRVHFLLGNHEYMVLHKDLRYLHPKYVAVSDLFKMSYEQLFSENTVLGRWIRTKHTMVRINNILFVHGGISPEFLLKHEFDIETINRTMRESIGRTKEDMKTTDFYSTYFGSQGPVWYRGYFNDDLQSETISDILDQINSEKIVVGHCSVKEVVSMYDQRIFGVDSSIKLGHYGEILLIVKNAYYRGTKDGKRIPF